MLEGILLSIIVTVIRGGQIKRLGQLDIQKSWLVFLPGLLVASLWLSRVHGLEWMSKLTFPLHAVAYGMVLALVVLNRRLPGMLIFGVGMALNFAVMAANGGKMPVSYEAAKSVGMQQQLEHGATIRHATVDKTTKLRYLADVIPTPRPPFPMPGVVSIGDIILSVGLFWLIQWATCPGKRRRKQLAADADAG
jgi:hypothetical protein